MCGPVCISKTRTTLLALQQLHQQIMDHHGKKCVAAAQAADVVSSNAAEGGASALVGAASNVMDLMMWLRNVKARTVAANKVALEAEQAKDALEREVQALEQAMKRPWTEASPTKNAEGMKVDEDSRSPSISVLLFARQSGSPSISRLKSTSSWSFTSTSTKSCALLHHQMSRRARASSPPTPSLFLARPPTLLREHTAAGVT